MTEGDMFKTLVTEADIFKTYVKKNKFFTYSNI